MSEKYPKEKPPWPAWLRFAAGAPVAKPVDWSDVVDEKEDEQERRLGFVTTGKETIDAIRDCIQDSRNVMLVGPRGTGKSFMAVKAVDAVQKDPRLGVVAVIQIQGDPNKPPSDYFDDGIAFTIKENRVLPKSLQAPFFEYAERNEAFSFEVDGEKEIRLFKKRGDGLTRVDRVVVFWDEGNRSSPAMQNAMLSLLAEGVIRRDGKEYHFPQVSCVLTRNPDGYDAQSAKMPSPLIDRFGWQLYVYNPDIRTMVGAIAEGWHAALFKQYQDESNAAVARLDLLTNGDGAAAPDPRLGEFLPPGKGSVRMRGAGAPSPAALREHILTAHPLPPEPKEGGGDADPAAKVDEARKQRDDAVRHALEALRREALCPQLAGNDEFRKQVGLIALVVLASWGNAREPAEKPGMQYLPPSMRRTLRQLGSNGFDPSGELAGALTILGDLTRYGTSIRAFVDMLQMVVGEAIRSHPPGEPLAPVTPRLTKLEDSLGRLLNHRCEAAFNTDREPAKTRKKTLAMVRIAELILFHCSDKSLKLCASVCQGFPGGPLPSGDRKSPRRAQKRVIWLFDLFPIWVRARERPRRRDELLDR